MYSVRKLLCNIGEAALYIRSTIISNVNVYQNARPYQALLKAVLNQ